MNLGKPVLWLALALSTLFILSALAAYFAFPPRPTRIDNPKARLAMTPEQLTASQNPNGFQALVSYDDKGFVPSTLLVRIGDTVRFFNDSSRTLWIASDSSVSGSSLYPGGLSECGSSKFDSCYALSPGEYFEFTFESAGDWGFSNTFDRSKSGMVQVAKK